MPYTRFMKPLYILKIGGSIVTFKHKKGVSIRVALLKKIADSIKKSQKIRNFNLILIHGAGAGGHQLAKKYELEAGAEKDDKKWYGSFISRVVNQHLNNSILEIFVKKGIRAVTVNTSSVVIQEGKKIKKINLEIIKEALLQNCIPVLYGEMVFDRKLGMTICSGDAIAPYLANKFKAKKIFFASDIDGIFSKDPHLNKDAKLIEKINIKEIDKKVNLTHSHNIDVTGGLLGKIEKIKSTARFKSLELIEIFNGFEAENYTNIFLGNKFKHTSISQIKNSPEAVRNGL